MHNLPANFTAAAVSPMLIADRLITLAQDADRAGYRGTAASLVSLVYSVLDEPRTPIQFG